MHTKGPAFLTDMGLLMFLAVTVSLLGYCQTDEKGKRRDSTLSACSPFLSPPSRAPSAFSSRRRGRASKEIRILLSASPFGRPAKGGETAAAGGWGEGEKERRRLTFMAAGMSSSREFTYSGSGLMVAAPPPARARARTHSPRGAFNSTRDRCILRKHPRTGDYIGRGEHAPLLHRLLTL